MTVERVEDVEIAIIGSGFSGIGTGLRLLREGRRDFVILERAGELGGTWRDNTYPGCCCDIPSHVYSYSFELNAEWSRGFASQAEILEYLRSTAERHGLGRHLRLRHEVTEARWDAAAERWQVVTTSGRFRARFLVSAAGPLSEPALPRLPGLERFRGAAFHSAQWDHGHDLTAKRVAVVGTGASAIQFVPQIQPNVAALHLFQRTPAWVMPRLDRRITEPERRVLRALPFTRALVRWVLYWLLEVRVVAFRHPALLRLGQRVALRHLRRQVPDPGLRDRLTPDYTMGCKRILLSDDFYPALTGDNVQVHGEGIAEVREHSVVTASGAEIPLDTIIFATGFQVSPTPIASRIRGRDGRTLQEHWTPSMSAYLGLSVAGFPNMFIVIGPNTGLGHNSMVFMVESQLNYMIGCLDEVGRRGASSVEVRSDVQRRFNREVDQAMTGTVWTIGGCHSWYLDETGRNTSLWPGWSARFRQRTRRFEPHKYRFTAPATVPVPGR